MWILEIEPGPLEEQSVFSTLSHLSSPPHILFKPYYFMFSFEMVYAAQAGLGLIMWP